MSRDRADREVSRNTVRLAIEWVAVTATARDRRLDHVALLNVDSVRLAADARVLVGLDVLDVPRDPSCLELSEQIRRAPHLHVTGR